MDDQLFNYLKDSKEIFDQKSLVSRGEIEHLQSAELIEVLDLPNKLIFLDVNGTLFPDESVDGGIPYEDLEAFKSVSASANEQGWVIGLCSDSPLLQLQQLASRLEIHGPIGSENGNMVTHNDKTVIQRKVTDIDLIKHGITFQARELGLEQDTDWIAPEFGGKMPELQLGKWAFGAGRQTSISVSGPKHLIEHLGTIFAEAPEVSVDVSPKHNFFAVHPEGYKYNKGKMLTAIAATGRKVLMIGNSESDLADSSTNVISAVVGNANIKPDKEVKFKSQHFYMKGVVDIISQVLQEKYE